MSNQDCPGVPVAAIGKVGVLSVSGGHDAADTFANDRIDAIRRGHAKDVPLLGELFFGIVPLLTY